MTVRSYAKINLGLRVLGRRGDGFHELSTVFHRVNLHDTVQLAATDGGVTLESDRDDIPTDDGNLCVRAARLLLDGHRGHGVHIVLRKSIPMGAGLGGGSSNAATVLRHLPTLLGLRVSEDELREMAALLGSDVPFFLQDGSAVARGRGEVLEYVAWSCPWWILLVNPGIHVSTAWAYGALRLEARPADPDMHDLLARAPQDATALATLLRNDFEAPVMDAHPGIREAREAMLRAGAAGALMSGSGSSVFGLFADEAAARACAAGFAPGQVLCVTPPNFSPVAVVRGA